MSITLETKNALTEKQKKDIMSRKIIALAGRKHSGKTVLSDICRKDFGFKIVNFAGAMKLMVAEYLNISIDELNERKEFPYDFRIDSDYLAEKIGIPISVIHKRNTNSFVSIRNALQFLGTQIIRELSPNWHINQLKNKIDSYPDDNFLIDDLRFPNELEFIKSVGGESWYIIRPSEYDLSNHESEIGVCWNDFGNNVIINNRSLRLFQKKWSQYLDEIINHPTLIHETHFLKSGIHTKEQLRTQLINKLKTSSTESVSQEIGCSRDKIVWWCDRLLVPISREEYYYDHTSFLFPTLEASYCAGILTSDGCIKLNPHKTCPRISLACMDFELVNTLKSFLKTNRPIYTRIHPISKKMIYELECGNSYVLQNLKWWNIKPRKSQKEEIPDIIKTNEECMKQWIVGLIDGDGSIFITKRGSLGLTILASREIIEFLEKFIPIKGSKRCNVKNTKLYELHWNNHKVVDVRNWLSPKIFLHRKWNKINEFISAGAENPRVFRPWDECDL